MHTEPTYEVSFVDLFYFLKRGLVIALGVGLALGAAAYFLSRNSEPTYRARNTLLAAQTNAADLQRFGVSLATAPAVDVSAYRTAALSAPVVQNALRQLGAMNPDLRAIEKIREKTTVRTEETRTSSLLHIDVENMDPSLAADTANAIATALLAWDRGRAENNLRKIADTLEQQIVTLDEQIRSLQVNAEANDSEISAQLQLRETQRQQLFYARTLQTSAIGLLETVEPALAPLRPVAPKPVLNAALTFILGIFLSYGVLLILQALNTKLRDTDDLANVTGLPVMAEFPKLPDGKRQLPREAVSYLRTNLLFSTQNANPKVLLVTSSLSAEGKSSVAMNLADSFARNDYRTLLVDADLRKPVVAGELKIDAGQGNSLQEHLENPREDLTPVRVSTSPSSYLDVIPTYEAAPNPTELLSLGFRDCLDKWRQSYDVIVIDSAPVLPVADTLTIAPLCTGTVLVSSMKKTDRKQVKSTVALLQRMGVRLLGVAATQVTESAKGEGQYGYGYGYGTALEQHEPVKNRRQAAMPSNSN